jgi:hypothetical protein
MKEFFANFGFPKRINESKNLYDDNMLIFFQFCVSEQGFLMINPISSFFKTFLKIRKENNFEGFQLDY